MRASALIIGVILCSVAANEREFIVIRVAVFMIGCFMLWLYDQQGKKP